MRCNGSPSLNVSLQHEHARIPAYGVLPSGGPAVWQHRLTMWRKRRRGSSKYTNAVSVEHWQTKTMLFGTSAAMTGTLKRRNMHLKHVHAAAGPVLAGQAPPNCFRPGTGMNSDRECDKVRLVSTRWQILARARLLEPRKHSFGDQLQSRVFQLCQHFRPRRFACKQLQAPDSRIAVVYRP